MPYFVLFYFISFDLISFHFRGIGIPGKGLGTDVTQPVGAVHNLRVGSPQTEECWKQTEQLRVSRAWWNECIRQRADLRRVCMLSRFSPV